MKELKLTTWERVQLLRCVPPTAPTIEDVAKHLRVGGKLELSEEEKELVGWKETRVMTPNGPGMTTMWAPDKADYVFEINLEDADFEHLKGLVAQRQDWPVNPLTIVLHDKMKQVGEKENET